MIDPVLQADLTDITSQLKLLQQRVTVLEKTISEMLKMLDKNDKTINTLKNINPKPKKVK